ncbi:protein eyes shut homolog [Ctenodactylus gundi]
MTNKSMVILSLVVLHSSFIQGKTTCKWPTVQEWRPQPSSHVVNWTLPENFCQDFCSDCRDLGVNTKSITSCNQVIPQICPLQIQLGDSLLISSDPSLQFSEINLMNVSEAAFIDCLQNTRAEDQLLFGCQLRGVHTVHPRWLSVGTHYFITVMESGPSPCHMGLRLNVTVKQQLCQETVSSDFCSGHGKCLSNVWSKAYSCCCQPSYSGKYCQELDMCYDRPCLNNGSCTNIKEKWSQRGYECVCSPPFTGQNCSEIIGQCQPHSCVHGKCKNITANSFICECDEQFSGFTGKNCENVIDQCRLRSISCRNEEWCFSVIERFRVSDDVKIMTLRSCRGSAGSISATHLRTAASFLITQLYPKLRCEGDERTVISDVYIVVASNCSESSISISTPGRGCPSEDATKICRNGCSCLIEDSSWGYLCLCALRGAEKTEVENIAVNQGKKCQCEDICKGKIDGFRFYTVNVEYCLGSHSTSVPCLCLARLHNCSSCSCLQRCEKNICKIETEDYKSVASDNGPTRVHLSGNFFYRSVPEFTGEWYPYNPN